MKKNTNSSENILSCALALFSEKGYDAVSVNEIVEMAGITKPTLYYFFGSKEGVFKQILEENYGKLNHALSVSSKYNPNISNYNEDVYPVLLRIVKAYFLFATQNKSFYLMVLSLMFAPPTSLTARLVEEFHKSQYEIITATFDAISKVHLNLKGKQNKLTWTFIAMINAYIGFWHRGYGELSDAVAHDIVHQFMHGIYE